MINIEMGNVLSKLNNLDSNIAEKIAQELSYSIGGFGAPKQTKYTFNINNGVTYTGLIPRVLNILKSYNLQYKINDKRIKPEPNMNFKITKEYEMRDYQREIVDRITSRETVQAATSSGKTFIMANVINKYQIGPVLIIAPKVSLAIQIKNEFEKFFPEEKIGISIGNKKDIQNITVGTPQSISDEVIKNTKMLIYDECHNIPSFTLSSISNKAHAAYYRYGFSASPWRDGEDDILIEAALNIRKPILSINASKLIAKNKLTPCEINFVKIAGNVEWQGNYNNTYDKVIVNNDSRNNKIIDIVEKSLKDGRKSILLLISKIKHGEILLNKLKKIIPVKNKEYIINNKIINVCNIEFLSGNDDVDVREAVFQAIQDGFCQILIGSTIADEGLSLSKLDTLILCANGKSSTKAFQRIGRVLRLYPGKIKAIVYDFIDTNSTFYNQAMIRQELYKTEPLWKINYID